MNIENQAATKALIESERGFSLLEVMIAMVILAFSMLGVMGMLQWGDYGVKRGAIGARSLEMAQGRIEAKRTQPWEALLTDDLNLDGITDIVMRDDGLQEDVTAGDGIFTAHAEEDGIRLVWTVHPNRTGSLRNAGMAVIHVSTRYQTGDSLWRDIKIGTLRVNPDYVGLR